MYQLVLFNSDFYCYTSRFFSIWLNWSFRFHSHSISISMREYNKHFLINTLNILSSWTIPKASNNYYCKLYILMCLRIFLLLHSFFSWTSSYVSFHCWGFKWPLGGYNFMELEVVAMAACFRCPFFCFVLSCWSFILFQLHCCVSAQEENTSKFMYCYRESSIFLKEIKFR